MNPTHYCSTALSRLSVAALLSTLALTAGCGGEKALFKVNGQDVTRDEYIKKLERQQINLGNNVTVTAEPYVIDQLVSNKILLAEAAKTSVMPSDDDVNKLYQAQKDLYENRTPGKKFDEYLSTQGATPDEIKSDLRAQLAEANVYAKLMNLNEEEVQRKYNEVKDRLGLPARVQMRMVLLPAGSTSFSQATKAIAEAKNDAKKFEAAARAHNSIPALKAVGGLQIVPNEQIPPTLKDKLLQAAEGTVVGPVDWPLGQGQSAKAWVRIEKRLPAFNLPQDQALPLIRMNLVQQKVAQPENDHFRKQIMKQKLDASFESGDSAVQTVWTGIKRQAQEAGIAETAPAPGAPAPGAAAPATTK